MVLCYLQTASMTACAMLELKILHAGEACSVSVGYIDGQREEYSYRQDSNPGVSLLTIAFAETEGPICAMLWPLYQQPITGRHPSCMCRG